MPEPGAPLKASSDPQTGTKAPGQQDAGNAADAKSASSDTATRPEAATAPDERGTAADADRSSAPPPARHGGALAPLLGGVLAAGIGAGAVLFFLPAGWQDRTDPALEQRISALEGRPASDAAALQPLEARLDALETALADRMDDAPALPPEAEERLSALEAGESAAALDTLRERVDALQTALDEAEARNADQLAAALAPLAQRIDGLEAGLDAELGEQIEAAVADALAAARTLQEARAQEIDAAEQDLARSAQRLAAREALATLFAAAESGSAAPQAVADIAAYTDPPAALGAFADGVPTLAALQDSFPELARAALAAAPPPPDAGAGDRLLGFLRQQTGARSLAPREGDDPDAVLSRAEAQVRQGDLARALDTLQALPDPSAAVLAPWRAQAEARLTALQALDQVQADLGSE